MSIPGTKQMRISYPPGTPSHNVIHYPINPIINNSRCYYCPICTDSVCTALTSDLRCTRKMWPRRWMGGMENDLFIYNGPSSRPKHTPRLRYSSSATRTTRTWTKSWTFGSALAAGTGHSQPSRRWVQYFRFVSFRWHRYMRRVIASVRQPVTIMCILWFRFF